METPTNKIQIKKNPLNTLSIMGKVIAVFGVFVGLAFFFNFGIEKVTYFRGNVDRSLNLTWAATSIAIIIISVYWWSFTEVVVEIVNKLKGEEKIDANTE